jgi:hypothetical protein
MSIHAELTEKWVILRKLPKIAKFFGSAIGCIIKCLWKEEIGFL